MGAIFLGLIAIIGFIGTVVFLICYSTLTWGFIVYKFAQWFAVPLFHPNFSFTYWKCVGIVFLLSLFKNNSYLSIKPEYRDEKKEWTSSLIAPWITLLIAYFFKLN